ASSRSSTGRASGDGFVAQLAKGDLGAVLLALEPAAVHSAVGNGTGLSQRRPGADEGGHPPSAGPIAGVGALRPSVEAEQRPVVTRARWLRALQSAPQERRIGITGRRD